MLSFSLLGYQFNKVYHGISTRFLQLHHIKISDHIDKMLSVDNRLEVGFNFVPKDAAKWEEALIKAGFQPDKREMHFGIIPSVGKVAALATRGNGYREKGTPSLHCAVAKDECSVHLDNIGFRSDGYGPDAGQHIVDELIWQDKIVPKLRRVMPVAVVDFLHRIHPVVPNSRQFRPFSQVGLELDLLARRSPDLQRQIKITIDLSHSCSNATCDAFRQIDGKSIRMENTLMLNFKVIGW
jgi:hypothetical protein